MTETTWGIIGPGDIAHNFADGLKEAPSGRLLAIASRSEERRASFGDEYGIAADKRYGDYQALADDPEVQAIYVSTPHPFHAQHAIMAMRGGKHVLCEKPAGLTVGQVTAMTEVAAQEGVFFMEAFMYRCHPQIARMIEIIESGEIGEVQHMRADFGFGTKFNASSRLFDRDLAGGGILDVGCYPVSLTRLVAGVAAGKPFLDPEIVNGTGQLGQTEVDEEAYAVLRFPSGVTAEIACTVRRNIANSATIYGTKGKLHLPNPWTPGRNAGPSDAVIEVTVDRETRREELKSKEQLFAFEAEYASAAIAAGKLEPEVPALGWADSIGNAETLAKWRASTGYEFRTSDVAINRIIGGLVPADLPRVPRRELEGLDKPMSSLVMGCDNRDTFAEGAIVWDSWLEAGGNAFDTAFVYGGGVQERALGQWIETRGVADEVVVITKGAHSPYCTPRAIAPQLEQSLDRLGLDRAAIYIMHRDNLDVPVGEFVDALNQLHEAGKIGLFGGSNWSVERFAEANAYAAANGLQPMRILNNNLSLAVMERPVWQGCITSNSPESLAYLRDNNVVHMSWSSQARGYFLPKELRNRLPQDEGPEACFGSDANAERRRRAEQLAEERGVSTHNIATAWVIAQSFPSFALIGPRSPGEIVSTLPGLGVNLTQAEAAWLNLEAGQR